MHRSAFDHDRPFEREFDGIQKFEPISHSESQVHILHVGRNEVGEYFYYVMELADDAAEPPRVDGAKLIVDRPEKQRDPPSSTISASINSQPSTINCYMPRTLKRELQQHGRLPFEECVRIGLALTNALAHLHKSGLVHRDVKPSNIIFVNSVPKLADIGLVTPRAGAGPAGLPGPPDRYLEFRCNSVRVSYRTPALRR